MFEPLPPDTEHLAKVVVDAAYKVHTSLGPGLLESVYEICLLYELGKREIFAERQVKIPVLYDGIRMEDGLRIDLLVDQKLILEVKAVEEMNRIYKSTGSDVLKAHRASTGTPYQFQCGAHQKRD